MKTVLITGCSSGIGLDAARLMQARGWRVIATCRRGDDLDARRAEGMEAIHLELADEGSTARAAAQALALGRIDALVNNAAFAIPGAVEDLPRGALRAIFEANLFGTHDLTRRLIPHFRQHGGRVINVSSVLGLVGVPWRGAYVATKFAMEGLTDVLRIEMAGTPVKVVLIEPGPIATRIRANSIPHFERWIDWENSPRAEQYRRSLLRRLYQPAARKDRFELPPRAVSERIAHALEAANPRPRYYVTVPTRISGIARRLLPTRGLDWVTRRG
ncbi:KR domain-containing protein [Paracoccus yeei]|jgi:NAD(P)-dependent dehydrogenase (short-subunit alcohol dehydrogenase family)|uniref:KR domain-containing protein n=2 Tax=Paracoccus TaxID=265 RepID=A0A1V0GSX8_9RHOB|nr:MULTISPECIES: SDR family NAD(P)-dependent oxidoreductase [Paracoccus]ARC36966.1 KR domain-containing protein [Paracoccus yeei]AWX93347.1 SDR family NAD(P)-dependent oxidoreductase [Paracoccus mutanolyticus]AYF03024.1 SDR family NAD(P)-dependent oxidoreductase [Paracoccus yeei]MBY0137675.1 SDR family NAD(P)-dependent oxidoreductase [Paracoccus yeei]OWJ93849.1 short-chain dehydrogenase/reductase [Paracoccus yeei]